MSRPTLNHVALAVPSIQRFLRVQEPLFGGFSRGPSIANARQRVNELFLTDGKVTVELLEPLGAGSPLEGFLRRNRSGGLYHLAFDVGDLDAELARIAASGGVAVSGPVPDVAFQERRIAFVVIDGQLVELIERPR